MSTGKPTVALVETKADRSHDFRGVVCPLNYVKTKRALEQMAIGQILEILLDDEGARSVPERVTQDGHKVLSTARKGDHWRTLIQKNVE